MDEKKVLETINELKKINPNNIDQNTIHKLAKNVGVKPAKFTKLLQKFQKKVANKPTLKSKKIGPNKPCPCDSGKKYKKCCGGKTKVPTPAVDSDSEPDLLQEDLDMELQDELEDLVEDELNNNDSLEDKCPCGSENMWGNCCGDKTKL